MKLIKIFLGGGVQLLHGDELFKGYRNDVIDPVIGQLNAIDDSDYCFIAKDYSDLTRNVVKGKQQNVYNKYIVHEADAALFIINGNIGNLTKHEIDCAVASTKKKKHPIVFIYGTNINDSDEILDYLNQEGIYYQHFFDNRDLAGKIKADLQYVATHLNKRKLKLLLYCAFITLIALCTYATIHKYMSKASINEDCVAQLYLMRYKDINSLTGHEVFNEQTLAQFRYEDSIISGNSIRIFPIVSSDSIIHSFNPILRLKLHNKNRNTIVLVEALLEVDSLTMDFNLPQRKFIPIDVNALNAPIVKVTTEGQTYPLTGFRQNIAYGETDDRYFFSLDAQNNCSFRARVKAKSQNGDYIYSNYIYLNYIK